MEAEKSPYVTGCDYDYKDLEKVAYPPYQTISDLLPKYTAKVEIGGWVIMLRDKTFTPEQIEHIRDFFGFEVENICE